MKTQNIGDKEKYIKNNMTDDMISAMLGSHYDYHKFQSDREKRLSKWLWGRDDIYEQVKKATT
jgi:hypothetical protein